jgi:hypothetical protein
VSYQKTGNPIYSIISARYDNTAVNPPSPTYYPITYTITSFTVYNYRFRWYRSIYCPVTSSGTLTVTYDYNGASQTVTGAVPSGTLDLSGDIFIATTTAYPITGGVSDATAVSTSFTGSPGSFPFSYAMCPPDLTLLSTTTNTISTEDPIPDGAVRVGNYYYFPPNPAGSGKITYSNRTVYTYNLVWNYAGCGSNPATKDGYIEILVEYNGNYSRQRAIASSSGGISGIKSTTDPRVTRPKITFTGSPSNWPDTCVEVMPPTTSVVNMSNYIPPGSIISNGYYYPPISGTQKRSKFLLTNNWFLSSQLNLFWNNDGIYSSTAGNSYKRIDFKNEYFDYSDIFIDITYAVPPFSNIVGGSSQAIWTDVPATAKTKRYKFDGYTSLQTFVSGQTNLGEFTYVNYDTEETWKIVLGPNNEFLGIELSSYQYWEPLATQYTLSNVSTVAKYMNFLFFTDKYATTFQYGKKTIPNFENYLVVDAAVVEVSNIKFTKVINFPNCGKIDIYKRKTGNVEGLIGNIFTSVSHGLTSGERIKIVGATSSTEGTNLNGIFYVRANGNDTFTLYSDSNLTSLVSPSDLKTYLGMKWVCVEGNTWSYQNTIYSPMGKNGYSSAEPQLLSYVETAQNAVDDPMERAVEYVIQSPGNNQTTNGGYLPIASDYNYYLDRNLRYPQAWVNGARSWNNFYPYQRNNELSSIAIGLRNGNNFGDTVRIKKHTDEYGSRYFLMVTEPGADESFPWMDNKNCENVKVVPSYLPYGRIHYYRIDTRPRPYKITYLGSDSSTGPGAIYNNSDGSFYGLGGPYYTYESYNLTTVKNIKVRDQQYNYRNYSFPTSLADFLTSVNNTRDDYWIGARFVSWTKNFIYDTNLSFNIPDINSNITEFNFADRRGRGADFEIIGGNVFQIVATMGTKPYVTSPYLNKYLNQQYERTAYRIRTPSYGDTTNLYMLSQLSGGYSSLSIIEDTTTQITNFDTQRAEYQTFGEMVKIDNGKLFIGWPSAGRGTEGIYYFKRSSDTSSSVNNNYEFRAILSSDGRYGFGQYFVSQGDFLITNKRDYYDDNGNLTTNPLDYLQVYRYRAIEDKYIYVSRVSPTVDISDEKYLSVAVDTYEITTNLSYDNTNTSSATYTESLAYKYDVYNNTLFLRDSHELSVFKYNDSTKRFDNKSHDFVKVNGKFLDTPSSIIKVAPSFAPATYDAVSEVDDGGYSKSIQIIDGSQFLTTIYSNYISSVDSQDLEYLSLFMKHVEGSGQKPLNTFIRGHDKFNDTMQLYSQGPIRSSGNINLFMVRFLSQDKALNLRIKGAAPLASGQKLHLETIKPLNNNLSLYAHYGQSSGNQNLFIETVRPSSGKQQLFIETVRPLSGNLPLYVQKILPFDNNVKLHLETIKPFNTGQILHLETIKPTTGNLNLLISNGQATKNIEFFLETVRPYSGYQELFLETVRPSSGNVQLYIKPAALSSGNMQLSLETIKPSTGNLVLNILFDPTFRTCMPLNLANPIVVGPENSTDIYGNPVTNIIFDNVTPLFIRSEYEGKPNYSSIMPLNIATYLSDDHASPAPLYLCSQLYKSSGANELYIMSSGNEGSYNSVPFYMDSTGTFATTMMPLLISRPTAQNLDLMLYNGEVGGNMNMYISGVPIFSGSLTLNMQSATGYINTGVTIHTKGTTL